MRTTSNILLDKVNTIVKLLSIFDIPNYTIAYFAMFYENKYMYIKTGDCFL